MGLTYIALTLWSWGWQEIPVQLQGDSSESCQLLSMFLLSFKTLFISSSMRPGAKRYIIKWSNKRSNIQNPKFETWKKTQKSISKHNKDTIFMCKTSKSKTQLNKMQLWLLQDNLSSSADEKEESFNPKWAKEMNWGFGLPSWVRAREQWEQTVAATMTERTQNRTPFFIFLKMSCFWTWSLLHWTMGVKVFKFEEWWQQWVRVKLKLWWRWGTTSMIEIN